MEAGGRSGGRAGLSGVDGLVALLILQPLLDIRRQRHLANLVKQAEKFALIIKANQAAAILLDFRDLTHEKPIAKLKTVSFLCPFTRLAQRLPGIVTLIL